MNGIARRPASSIVRRRTAGSLSGEPKCGPPRSAEPVAGGLEHQPHRGAHVLEPGQLLVGHHAGVQVRQQAGLLDHADRDRPQVLERRAGSRASASHARASGYRSSGRSPRVNSASLHPARRPAVGDRNRLLRRQERGVRARRRLGEGAVVTVVPAEHRERDEHLRRVGDDVAVTQVAQARRELHEPVRARRRGPRRGRVASSTLERLALLGADQRTAE